MMQIRSRLNVHVYPKLGDRPMGVLAKRPSLVQAWIRGRVPRSHHPGFTLRTYTDLLPDAADRARRAMDVFFEAGTGSAFDVPSGDAK